MEADLKTPEDKQGDEGESDGEHSESSAAMRSAAKMNITDSKPLDSETGVKKLDDDDEIKEREVVGGVSMESSLQVVFRVNYFSIRIVLVIQISE